MQDINVYMKHENCHLRLFYVCIILYSVFFFIFLKLKKTFITMEIYKMDKRHGIKFSTTRLYICRLSMLVYMSLFFLWLEGPDNFFYSVLDLFSIAFFFFLLVNESPQFKHE